MAGITPEKLIERLARGKTVAAIVLLGTDVYLRDLCRNRIIEAFVPEAARDWAVARIEGGAAGWEEVVRRAQTLPLLAPRQVLIVQDAEAVDKLGDKSRDQIVDALAHYLDSPAPFTTVLIEAAKLDGRLKFCKLLTEKAVVVDLTIGSESAAALGEQMAKDLGAKIDRDAATLLADILNNEPARIRNELEKLAAYTLGGASITAADVEALVVAGRRNTVWQLADMLAGRQRDAALHFLDNVLREGEPPAMIVGALAFRYRKLIEARALPPNMNPYLAQQQLGMYRPGEAEAALRNAHRVSKKDLLAGLVALADADSQLKSANPNPRAFMEFLVARLTSATPTS